MAHARSTDPETSHAAARSVRRIRESQLLVLRVLKQGPQSDAAIWSTLSAMRTAGGVPPMSESGARTRRSELVDAGLVEDSGRRVLYRTRRQAIVWRLTPAGLAKVL